MGQQDLSRRQILTGVVAAGGAGALGGRGTTTLLSDRETFTNNSIQGSASTAGTVELEVDVDSIDDNSTTEIRYSVNLPRGVNNNPSYVWVQVTDCPTPSASADVFVELRVECENQTYTLIDPDSDDDPEKSLTSAVNDLRENGGKQLLCSATEDQRCFEPGEVADVVLEVTGVSGTVDGPIEFEFEFYGEQCRYNTGSESPFGMLDSCDGGTATTGKAISWIAFCSPESGLEASIDDIVTTDDDDEPTSVEWSTKEPVDYVLIKAGTNYTIYDYDEADDDVEEGTATSGGDPDADFYGRLSGGAATGFGNTPGSVFGNDSSAGSSFGNTPGNNSASANPCELAADVAGDGDFPDDGTSIKFEYEGGEFKKES